MVEQINAGSSRDFDLRLFVMEALIELLADTRRPLRFYAARSLAMLGDDAWETAFPTADGPPVAAVLLEMDRPEVDEVLVGLLNVERAEDRREATRLIGLRHCEDAVPSLQVAAHSNHIAIT